jgi:hypothetical protein
VLLAIVASHWRFEMVTLLVHAVLFVGYGIGCYFYGVWVGRRSQQPSMTVDRIVLAPCPSCSGKYNAACWDCNGHGFIPVEQSPPLGVLVNNPNADLRKLDDLFDRRCVGR